MSTANERDVELNTRRKIPYLQATIYYFVYNINTMALYWKEKTNYEWINENKWIDNPWITIVECVGANSWDGKMRWILITKTTMVVNFNLQNSHWLTCPYRRRNLSGKLQKLASGKSSSCWLSFSAERNGNTKATKCVTFSFCLSTLVSYPF